MNLLAHDSKLSPPNSTCERCGERFACGGIKLRACWCAEVKMSPETLAELRQKYRHCLCPQCLEGFARGGINPAT